jgi:hypothetical protein
VRYPKEPVSDAFLGGSLLRLLFGRPLLLIGGLFSSGRVSAAAESIGIARTIAFGVVVALTAGAHAECSHGQNQDDARPHVYTHCMTL